MQLGNEIAHIIFYETAHKKYTRVRAYTHTHTHTHLHTCTNDPHNLLLYSNHYNIKRTCTMCQYKAFCGPDPYTVCESCAQMLTEVPSDTPV